MLTASELLYQRARRIGYIGAVVIVAGVGLLALLSGAADPIVDLLRPGYEPIVAAPLRW